MIEGVTQLILRKTGIQTWTLYVAKTGVELIAFTRCNNKEDAEHQARSWASSWATMHVEVEDE